MTARQMNASRNTRRRPVPLLDPLRNLFAGTSYLLVLTLAVGPIQWFGISNIELNLKYVHIPFYIMAAIGFWRLLRPTPDIRAVMKGIRPFLISFAVIFTMYFTSILWAETPGRLFVFILKNFLYFIGMVGCVPYLASLPLPVLKRSLVIGGGLAVVIFTVVAWFTLASKGLSMISIIATAIQTGNSNYLQFALFLSIFNENFSQGVSVSSSLRHTLIGFLQIALLALLYQLWTARSLLVFALFTVCLAWIVVSVSRSHFLIIASVTVLILFSMRKDHFHWLLGIMMAALAALVLLVISGEGILDILTSRFSNLSDDARVTQFYMEMRAIGEKPLFGHGIGANFGFSENVSHNLFLAAWGQAGLIAFFASVVGFFSLIYALGSRVLAYSTSPQMMCLVALLVLPIIRVQLGGGGLFTLPEWLAIALFYALFFRPSTAPARSAPRSHRLAPVTYFPDYRPRGSRGGSLPAPGE